MSIRRVFENLFLFSLFVIFSINTTDPDMWWHLKTGEYILENGIPTTDPDFSYTAQDNEWFMHEWLSEVVIYSVYDVVGLVGLAVFFSSITALAFAFLYFTMNGRPYLAGLITIYSAVLIRSVMNPRPQIFSLTLAIIFVSLIERYKSNRLSKQWLWLIVPLTVLWVNLHSGFVLGFTILGVYIVGEFLQHLTQADAIDLNEHLSKVQIRFLSMVTILSALASLLNPKTYQQWLYPFQTTLLNDVMQTFILEWQSPDFKETNGIIFAVFFFIGFLMLILSNKKMSWTDFLFFFGALWGGLQSTRNIPIFAIVALPIIVKHSMSTLQNNKFGRIIIGVTPEVKLSKTLSTVNIFLLIMGILIMAYYPLSQWTENDEAIAQKLPVEAVSYIKTENLDEQRVYNRYDWGGYLIWNDIQSFIDGRADLFDDEFLVEGAKPLNIASDWEEVLDKYQVDYILIKPDDVMTVLLDDSENWTEVYQDDIAIIYVRVVPRTIPKFG